MAKKEPTTAVAPTSAQPGTAVAAPINPDLAALLVEDAASMAPKFNVEDLAIPFLRVLQGLSPEVTRGSDKYLPDARPGMLINTVTQQVYDGEEGVLVIPVLFTPSFTEWTPRSAGGGFVRDWKADPSNMARCHRNEATNKDVTPEGTEMVRAGMYYIMVLDAATGAAYQCVLSLSGTQIKKSKRWNSIIMNLVAKHPVTEEPYTPAPFYMAYRITTVPESNDKGSWFGVHIAPEMATVQLPNGEKLYRAARTYAGAAAAGTVKVQDVAEATGVVIEGDDGGSMAGGDGGGEF